MDMDDFDEPSKAPSRTYKLMPKSKLKPQPKPKPKPKPEPLEPAPSLNSEPSNTSAPIKITEDDDKEEVKPKITEDSVTNGVVKMEIDAKEVTGPLEKGNDPMDVDKGVVEEEAGDMVVREIDVYFTPSIDPNTKLYVMQYPLRPCWRPYELDERCTEVRVKPECAEVEIDLCIDDTKNWDTDVASRLNMKKQTLSSSWLPPRATGYAAGVLIGNKLHLNPIHAVVQLRPSMEHINTNGAKKKNNVSSGAESSVKLEDSNEEKSIGPSKKQNKLMDSGNEQTPDSGECWIPLNYHGSKSDLSSRYLQKMVAQENSSIEFTMSPYDYMSSLCPGTSNNNIKPNVPSRRVLLSLPLEERIKKLFLEGPPVHRLAALRHLSPNDSIEDLLTVLQKHGQLVQGLWVPKTSFLFPNPKANERSTLAARDYILILFSKSLLISSEQLNVPLKLPLLKSFLNIFAVERPSFKDWKFKELTDTSFIELYPDIVRKQEKAWEVMEKNIYDGFSRAGKSGPKNPVTRPKKTITDETRAALRKALPKIFQNHKVCSFQLICQGLRDLAISQSTLPKADPRIAVAAASGVDAPEELQEVISEVATNIHGLYVLKSSPDHPESDSLRKVVINLLLARGRDGKLRRSDVEAAAKHELKREALNNTEYNKVMNDLCEAKTGSYWMLKSGDGKPS